MSLSLSGFPAIGIVLIFGFVFAVVYAILRGLFLVRSMRRFVHDLQAEGFVRVDGEVSRFPWYAQRSWSLPVFFRFELQKEHHGNGGPASRARVGALYIPLATSQTSSHVLHTLLEMESRILRGQVCLTKALLGWLSGMFPSPKNMLESAGRITLYTADILPAILLEQLPKKPTLVIRYGISPGLTVETLQQIVFNVSNNIHE